MTPSTTHGVRWFGLLPFLAAIACTERAAPSRQVGATRERAMASHAPNALERPTKHGKDARLRHAQKAGGWYPEDRVWAIDEMARAFRSARGAPTTTKKPIALIVPHAGWHYSGVAAAAAFRNLHRGDYRRVVLLGPSHRHAFAGYSLPQYDAYETPLGRIPLCAEAATLRDGTLVQDLPEADHGEHSLELQLPWLQETLGDFCMVPLLVGLTTEADDRALADRLAKLPRAETLFVVSSDFVHYGTRFDFTPFGTSATAARERVFDLEAQAIDLLARRDPAGFRQFITKTEATICGYRGQLVLLELLRQIAPEAEAVTFAHYSSADLGDERDESGSVGYVSMGFVDKGGINVGPPLRAPPTAVPCSADVPLDEVQGRALLRLAKATLSTKLLGTDALSTALSALPQTPRLDCKQAVFVTLRAHGQLRGCIGQVEPQYPLFEAIVHSAIDGALNDSRFEPVTPAELPGLSFEVTVLSVPQEVASYKDIVLGQHGIILSLGRRRALFLPQVPGEQGWNLEQTLRALSSKAGLADDAWQDSRARFSVFTGTVLEEPATASRGGRLP